MRLYNVKDKYIEFLKQYDKNVADNKKEKRPYVGIVLTINDMNYYAPLSSPKNKHLRMKNTMDFRKIDNGNLGSINLNNMIPVAKEALIEIDIANIEDARYKRLLQNQYRYIKRDLPQIQTSAEKLYKVIHTADAELNDNLLKIKHRCCNLPLLETIVKKYNNT